MFNRQFLLSGLFAALAMSVTAQTNNSNIQIGLTIEEVPRFSTAERPRIVPDKPVKTSAVGASVVVNTNELEREAFDILNGKRAERGLAPLVWSDAVAAVARVHSHNMAEQNFFGHRDNNNKMVSDRADDNHLGRWRSIGENIAFNRGYQDPITKAVDQWLNSQGHYENLMDKNWKESAVGVAVGGDGSFYFTQVFLRR